MGPKDDFEFLVKTIAQDKGYCDGFGKRFAVIQKNSLLGQ